MSPVSLLEVANLNRYIYVRPIGCCLGGRVGGGGDDDA